MIRLKRFFLFHIYLLIIFFSLSNNAFANFNICDFQSRSFGQLTQNEFVKLSTNNMTCKNNHENFKFSSLNLPYWIPILPLELIKLSFDAFAFLFQLNANIGKKYIYINNGPANDYDINKEFFKDFPKELPGEIKELQDNLFNDQLSKSKNLKPKRNFILKKKDDWENKSRFPFKWRNAVKMSPNEMWAVEGESTHLYGPLLTGAFILSEKISKLAYLGNTSLVAFTTIHRSNTKKMIRRVKKGTQHNIQVKVEQILINPDESKFGFDGFGLGGNSLATDVNYGYILKESSINLFAGAAMEINRISLFPISFQWLKESKNNTTFILEFDINHPGSKNIYNKVMDGDFRDIDSINDSLTTSPVTLIYKNQNIEENSYSRNKFYLPLIYSYTSTCKNSKSNRELFRDTVNEHKFYKLSTSSAKLCQAKGSGFLHNLFFNQSSKGHALSLGYMHNNTSTKNNPLGLLGSLSFSFEKASERDLNKIKNSVSNLGITSINEDLEKYIEQNKELKNHFDFKFTFFMSRSLLTKLFYTDKNKLIKTLNEYFKINSNKSNRKDHRKHVNTRLRERLVAKYIHAVLKAGAHPNLIGLTDKEFYDVANEFLDILKSSSGYKKYLFTTFKLLEKEIKKELGNDLNNNFNYHYSLYNSQPNQGYPLHRYNKNVLEVLDQDFQSMITLFNNSFIEEMTHFDVSWTSVASFDGNEGQIPKKRLNDIIQNKKVDQLVSYECNCRYLNEKQNESNYTELSISGIGFRNIDKENISMSSYKRAMYQCLQASQQHNSSTKNSDEVHYIHVPVNSCQINELSTTTQDLASQVIKTHKATQQALVDVPLPSQCDRNLLFKSSPAWLRMGLSSMIMAFSWRARGGGFTNLSDKLPLLKGNLATFTGGSLTSYISSNTCEDFLVGLKSSFLLTLGGIPGWGECFDMGSHPKKLRGDHKEKYYNDVPCMTIRTSFTTSMMSAYLKSRGYNFNQEIAGPSIIFPYLIVKEYNPELWHETNRSARADVYESFDIQSRIAISEYLVGLIYGYNFSKSLIEGPNQESQKKRH